MKRFRCNRCKHLLSLENELCMGCGSRLVFVPELSEILAWGSAEDSITEERSLSAQQQRYRLCQNYIDSNTCNWAVPADDSNPLCVSCRLTQIIPDLTIPQNLSRWYKLEIAKRRLIVGLLRLALPISNTIDGNVPRLAFHFLADDVDRVLTGHECGLITINIAEADDDERERRRVRMHEPYRTLVGHFRHEVGHYYWDVLIGPSPRLDGFRSLFGDERADYAQALEQYYEHGAASDWQLNFVSAYASTHPWEDWAETWAHYLHMVDSLDTAYESGLSVTPRQSSEPRLEPIPGFSPRTSAFGRMIEAWHALTYVLNDLNRGLGLHDAYPFVLSDRVIAKLEFVHDTIQLNRERAPMAATPA